MPSCHYLISGRVQGVGFRAFTRDQASRASIQGWVRNLKDGRVEVLAEGSEQNLAALENILRSGPPHARVDNVETRRLDEKISTTGFQLVGDGDSEWVSK